MPHHGDFQSSTRTKPYSLRVKHHGNQFSRSARTGHLPKNEIFIARLPRNSPLKKVPTARLVYSPGFGKGFIVAFRLTPWNDDVLGTTFHTTQQLG